MCEHHKVVAIVLDAHETASRHSLSQASLMVVNCYSWAFSALKISKKIAMCLQFTVLFVEIVNIFILVWIYKVETPFLWSNVKFNSICRLKKRRCEKVLMNSLSATDWLSKPHSLSEATSSISGCKTLEEDKSEINALSVQPARPASMLSLLTLSAPRIA